MDTLIAFLREKLGGNAIGLIAVAIAGATIFYYSTHFFVTSEKYEEGCSDMAIAMEKGDKANYYQIISLQIESLQRERMQLENFVIMNQNGQYNDVQRQQMEKLTDKIKKLEIRREEVIRKLSGE